ncbi:uncharacterized protein LOC129949279 isoform X1 [Eupeodes corollae]|uniref:uncharacterized protein LOC129949279 isoform X1 n=1 Tax=Eupeodes corollae TaxID=290404 RepID=UPI00248F77FA|nr:uncharacterized protein LOC129949279 isoform X1 [Eupeodes corollae]
MIQLFLVYALAVGSITAAPQFFDFNNGGVGVNFAGYSARAGLGGLLTGNAADGGLSASAGTPFGQRAAAGLGGSVNGNAAGVAYAGAQANDDVGASAAIGGSTGSQKSGFLGAESHSNGGGNSVTKTLIQDSTPELTVPTTIQKVTTVQKIKPPKKYIATQANIESKKVVVNAPETVTVVKTYNRPGKHFIKKISRPSARRVGLFKQISFAPVVSQRFGGEEQQVNVVNPTTYKTVTKVNYPVVTKEVNYNPLQYLNIPIGILRSLQESLQPVVYSKQVSVQG